MEKDVSVIPKASTEKHIVDNLKARNLELEKEDIKKIDGIEQRERMVDPDYAPWNR